MRNVLLLFVVFQSTQSFATGPDETIFDLIRSNERLESVNTKQLVCNSSLTTFALENLGSGAEGVTLVSHSKGSCELVKEIRSGDRADVRLGFSLYRETPIDWLTGKPTGAPSYYSCVTMATFANGLVVSSWYWHPRDPSACE
jgi:hypothetical protein